MEEESSIFVLYQSVYCSTAAIQIYYEKNVQSTNHCSWQEHTPTLKEFMSPI